MYSESDLEAAIAAGVMTDADALRFRDFMAQSRATSLVDEEHFRLVSGFNDIFVAIASVLLFVALAWLGGEAARWLGPLLVAAAAWGLAEFFTRRRRMAFPSILLLLAFAGGVFATIFLIFVNPEANYGPEDETRIAAYIAIAALVALAADWLHWRRFHVPIAIAAGAAACVALAAAGLWSVVGDSFERLDDPLLFACGIAVFAFAMRWDISDPRRETRRADVAFWLHLLAAPLLVHPIFSAMGVMEGTLSIAGAALVIALYIAMALIAVAIDRRALMVSSLAYVLFALNGLFDRFGAVDTNIALAALIIGSALLLLSAFWHNVRAMIVRPLPEGVRMRLPAFDRVVAV